MDEALLRTLSRTVIGILVRRGADFAAYGDTILTGSPTGVVCVALEPSGRKSDLSMR